MEALESEYDFLEDNAEDSRSIFRSNNVFVSHLRCDTYRGDIEDWRVHS